jgi:thioredoxin 1
VLLQARRLRGRRPPELADSGEGLAGGSVVYYFHSPVCAACRAMNPAIEALARRHPRVVKVDISRDPSLARQLGVRATPTTLLVVDGEVREVWLGAKTLAQLEALVASVA